MTDRLAELEAKVVALNTEIAVLKAGKRAPQPEPRDELRIVALNNEITAGMPTLRELEKLYTAVRNLHRGRKCSATNTTTPDRFAPSAARFDG
jgi:hypothetical protein